MWIQIHSQLTLSYLILCIMCTPWKYKWFWFSFNTFSLRVLLLLNLCVCVSDLGALCNLYLTSHPLHLWHKFYITPLISHMLPGKRNSGVTLLTISIFLLSEHLPFHVNISLHYLRVLYFCMEVSSSACLIVATSSVWKLHNLH